MFASKAIAYPSEALFRCTDLFCSHFRAALYEPIFVLQKDALFNGRAQFKNVNKFLNNNIYSCLETDGSQSSNQYLNVHFFNTSVN
jgi:hypothetical protein